MDNNISEIVKNQKQFFLRHETFDVQFRLRALKVLKNSIINHKNEIFEAFMTDYNKSEFDVVATEFSLVMNELKYFQHHLKSFAKPKRVHVSFLNLGAKGYRVAEAYGTVLIVAPWNYPLQLSFCPLIASIACGNTTVLKPSNYTPSVAKVIQKILNVFDDKFVAVVLGGREQNQMLFEQKFDFVFFTGGTDVGKILYQKQSQFLTPVLLELGGKSPCVIDCDADLNLAAKRSVWGKFLNAGQTCVAPDYFFVHKDIKNQFIQKTKEWIRKFFYEDGVLSKDYPYIVNDKHVERLKGLVDKDKLIFGGGVVGRQFEPTILDNVSFDDSVMKEEIFGPILPIIEFEDLELVVKKLNSLEKPLALYYFGKNKAKQKFIVLNTHFGGGCINDCIMHLTEEKLPFGGVGNSGIGSYHGKKSFEAFSHIRSLLVKNKMELNMKYPPSTTKKTKIMKWIFGIK